MSEKHDSQQQDPEQGRINRLFEQWREEPRTTPTPAKQHTDELDIVREGDADTPVIHVYPQATDEQEDQEPHTAPGTTEDDAQEEPDTPVSAPRGRPRRLWYGIATVSGMILSVILIGYVVIPLLVAQATVTIMPNETTINITAAIPLQTNAAEPTNGQVPGTVLPTVTLTQARTVPTTGSSQQLAQPARGIVTFYNAAPYGQAIPAGTLLQSASGVQIVTEQDAFVPAGSFSANGQQSVSVRATTPGPAGNLAAGSIAGPCCRAYILVQNSALRGGHNARTFQSVSQTDIDQVAKDLQVHLMQSAQAALQTQVDPSETLAPPTCHPTIQTDHRAGEEAQQVTVSIQARCSSVAYDTQAMQAALATRSDQQAHQQRGDTYQRIGDLSITVTGVQHQQQAITVQVRATSHYAYQISPIQREQIKRLIAGKDQAQATQLLLQQPGISTVSISPSNQSAGRLPDDPNRIQIVLLYLPTEGGNHEGM